MKKRKATRKATMSVVTVTPKRAAEWLTMKDKNFRALNARTIGPMVRAMENGVWDLTGDECA